MAHMGVVYFIATECRSFVKIGMSKDRDAGRRLEHLQIGNPLKLELLHEIHCDDVEPALVERDLHQCFLYHRRMGEWFSLAGSLADFLSTLMLDGPKSTCRPPIVRGRQKSANGYLIILHESMSIAFNFNGKPRGFVKMPQQRAKNEYEAEIRGLCAVIAELAEENCKLAAALDGVTAMLSKASEITEGFEDSRFRHCERNDKRGPWKNPAQQIAHAICKDANANKVALEDVVARLRDFDAEFIVENAIYCTEYNSALEEDEDRNGLPIAGPAE